MTTQAVEEIQQEYIAAAAAVDYDFLTNKNIGNRGAGKRRNSSTVTNVSEAGLEEMTDLMMTTARAAGLDKEADQLEICGQRYAVDRCDQCGEFTGHPYHCNQSICPTCYYRNLFRFMNRHRATWDESLGFVIVDVDYGSYREYEVEEGMTRAKMIHQDLLCHFPFLKGGVYHIQLVWNETYHWYRILYHYFLNAHPTYAFLIGWALDGQAVLDSHEIFADYDKAQKYFIRSCCQYPADILLDCAKVAWYLGLMKRRKLIQGFRDFYRVSGGSGRGKKRNTKPACPCCGGKLVFAGLTYLQYAWWDGDHKCYRVDPGAPGL